MQIHQITISQTIYKRLLWFFEIRPSCRVRKTRKAVKKKINDNSIHMYYIANKAPKRKQKMKNITSKRGRTYEIKKVGQKMKKL